MSHLHATTCRLGFLHVSRRILAWRRADHLCLRLRWRSTASPPPTDGQEFAFFSPVLESRWWASREQERKETATRALKPPCDGCCDARRVFFFFGTAAPFRFGECLNRSIHNFVKSDCLMNIRMHGRSPRRCRLQPMPRRPEAGGSCAPTSTSRLPVKLVRTRTLLPVFVDDREWDQSLDR